MTRCSMKSFSRKRPKANAFCAQLATFGSDLLQDAARKAIHSRLLPIAEKNPDAEFSFEGRGDSLTVLQDGVQILTLTIGVE